MTVAPGAPAPTGAPAVGGNAPASGAPIDASKGKNSRVSADPPRTAGEAKPPVPDFKGTKHRVKVGGQEQELDYDALVTGYQKAADSDRRYREASQLAKSAESARAIEKALETGNFKAVEQRFGPEKARQMAEAYLIEQMEYDNLPQHEKDLREERKRRAEVEARLSDREKKDREDQQRQVADRAFQDLETEVSEALTAAGKKANPRLALRILEQIESRLVAKEQKIPAAEAYKHADRALKQDVAFVTADMTPEEAIQYFPKEFLDRLMDHRVNQALDGRQARRPPRTTAPTAPKDQKPMGIEEKFKLREQQLSARRK